MLLLAKLFRFEFDKNATKSMKMQHMQYFDDMIIMIKEVTEKYKDKQESSKQENEKHDDDSKSAFSFIDE